MACSSFSLTPLSLGNLNFPINVALGSQISTFSINNFVSGPTADTEVSCPTFCSLIQVTEKPTFCSNANSNCSCAKGNKIYIAACDNGSCLSTSNIEQDSYEWSTITTTASTTACPSVAVTPSNWQNSGCFCRTNYDVDMPDESQGTFQITTNVNPAAEYTKNVKVKCHKGSGADYQSVVTNQFSISVSCDPSVPNFQDGTNADPKSVSWSDNVDCYFELSKALLISTSAACPISSVNNGVVGKVQAAPGDLTTVVSPFGSTIRDDNIYHWNCVDAANRCPLYVYDGLKLTSQSQRGQTPVNVTFYANFTQQGGAWYMIPEPIRFYCDKCAYYAVSLLKSTPLQLVYELEQGTSNSTIVSVTTLASSYFAGTGSATGSTTNCNAIYFSLFTDSALTTPLSLATIWISDMGSIMQENHPNYLTPSQTLTIDTSQILSQTFYLKGTNTGNNSASFQVNLYVCGTIESNAPGVTQEYLKATGIKTVVGFAGKFYQSNAQCPQQGIQYEIVQNVVFDANGRGQSGEANSNAKLMIQGTNVVLDTASSFDKTQYYLKGTSTFGSQVWTHSYFLPIDLSVIDCASQQITFSNPAVDVIELAYDSTSTSFYSLPFSQFFVSGHSLCPIVSYEVLVYDSDGVVLTNSSSFIFETAGSLIVFQNITGGVTNYKVYVKAFNGGLVESSGQIVDLTIINCTSQLTFSSPALEIVELLYDSGPYTLPFSQFFSSGHSLCPLLSYEILIYDSDGVAITNSSSFIFESSGSLTVFSNATVPLTNYSIFAKANTIGPTFLSVQILDLSITNCALESISFSNPLVQALSLPHNSGPFTLYFAQFFQSSHHLCPILDYEVIIWDSNGKSVKSKFIYQKDGKLIVGTEEPVNGYVVSVVAKTKDVEKQGYLVDITISEQGASKPVLANQPPRFVGDLPKVFSLEVGEELTFALPLIFDINSDTYDIFLECDATFLSLSEQLLIFKNIETIDVGRHYASLRLVDSKNASNLYKFEVNIVLNIEQRYQIIEAASQKIDLPIKPPEKTVTIVNKNDEKTPLIAKIVEISSLGELSIEFNTEMLIKETTWIDITNQFIDIYVQPRDNREYNQSQIELRWEMVSYEERLLQIQINFTEPIQISPSIEQDLLKTHQYWKMKE